MTTSQVSGKRIAREFNKYLEYKKHSERTGASFTEKINQVASDTELKPPTTPQHVVRGGRRYAPPQFSKPKTITTEQAQRLARFAPLIQEAAAKHNVPVELICGVILQESGGNPRARSPAGAKGLMQLMPGTARRFGVKNAYDPKQNIEGGTAYLRFLIDRFKGNIELVLAGYNAGEGNVEKHGNKIPPFAETRAYVPNVLGYTQSMINILVAARSEDLPSHARRV
jgi:soluble lytic murein transglycosylase-like protein